MNTEEALKCGDILAAALKRSQERWEALRKWAEEMKGDDPHPLDWVFGSGAGLDEIAKAILAKMDELEADGGEG
jgi:hypothetical protein